MEQRKVINIINNLEKKIDQGNLTLKNNNIWQILRIYIFQALSREEDKRKPITGKSELLSKSFKKIWSIFKNSIYYLKYRSENRAKIEDSEVLFLSSVWYRRVEIEGKFFNPYVDPLIYKLDKEKIGCVLHEYSGNNDKFNKNSPFEKYLNQSAILFAQVKSIFSINISKADKQKINNLVNQINQEISSTGFQIDKNVVTSRISLFFYLKNYFDKLLNKFNPKVIIIVCYYNFYGFALISAANKKGVKTFDLQHGVQSQNHIAYGRRVLNGNDQLLPYGYIVNSNRDSLNIKEYQQGKKVYILKRQFDQFLENDLVNSREITTKLSTLKNISSGKNKVLLSLQYGRGIGSKMRELLIKSKNNNIFWWIRLHPNMKDYEIQEVKKILSDIGLSDFEINYSSALPIEIIFPSIDIQITYYSSTALDALDYQKRTILIAKEALELFDEEISAGKLIYEEDVDEILNIIGKEINSTNDFYKENEKTVESFENVVRNMLHSND